MPTRYPGTEEETRALNMFIALSRGTESFLARLNSTFSDSRLTPSQFGVLETLYHLGPLMPSQIADKLLRSRNNLTMVISNLERDGLVARRLCPEDRRAFFIELTSEGRTMIERLLPIFVGVLVQETRVLSPDEQETLRKLLKKLGKAS